MSFDVTADAYGRFMGRYSEQLGEPFLDFVGARPGHRSLDVGCGTGALTARLMERLGTGAVAAVDPSASFVAAARERLPAVDVRQAGTEALPFEDGSFDLVLAQLVVHFMNDAAGGVAEMRRVARPGGTVAASVWDHAGGRGPLASFWDAVRAVDEEASDESGLVGVRRGQLDQLFQAAGLRDVRDGELTVRVRYESFEQWWEPFTLGVGPAGAYVAGLDDHRRQRLRDHLAERMEGPSFDITATAWCARGTA